MATPTAGRALLGTGARVATGSLEELRCGHVVDETWWVDWGGRSLACRVCLLFRGLIR